MNVHIRSVLPKKTMKNWNITTFWVLTCVSMLFLGVLTTEPAAFEVRELDALPKAEIENVVLGEPAFSHATTSYVNKQLADSFDFPFVSGIKRIDLTTKKEDKFDDPDVNIKRKENDPGAKRRKPLTILNYSSIAIKDDIMQLYDIPSRGLMIQFALSLKYHYKQKHEKDIVVTIEHDDNQSTSAAVENYERLKKCMANKVKLNDNIETLVFGYKSIIDEVWAKRIKAECEIDDCNGWVGTAYRNKDGALILVLDSDINHSYHVEVLAENINRILISDKGSNIRNVVLAGSAGYIGDKNVSQYTFIYPRIILNESGDKYDNKMTKKDENLHTSVPSVLSESKKAIDILRKNGVTSIDMEFAYVADKLYGLKYGKQPKNINLYVACLVTDFPYKARRGQRLAMKDKEAKKNAIMEYAEQLADELRLEDNSK